MNSWASWESGKPPPSQEPQTTPPAAPEKATIPSRSPQRAQAPSSGEKPAASASLSRKASADGARARRRRRPSGARRALVEQRQVAAEQVVGGAVRLGRVEQPQHGVAGRARRRRSPGRRSAGRVAVDGRGAGHRAEVAAALVQHQVEPEERLQPAAEARLRPPRALRDRVHPPALGACRGGGSGRPRRSGCCAARPLGLEASGHGIPRRTDDDRSGGPGPPRLAGVARRPARDRRRGSPRRPPSPPACRPASAASGSGSGSPEARQKTTSPSNGVKTGSMARATPALAIRATLAQPSLVEAGVGDHADERRALRGPRPRSSPAGPRRAASSSTLRSISPSSPRGPAISAPSAPITSPVALTTASAATVSPAPESQRRVADAARAARARGRASCRRRRRAPAPTLPRSGTPSRAASQAA